ncbi:transcription elongation factor SPT5-like, partial [Pollicipes pollicipes]|uniref:transcription elongation factor SPT5-like n=1 Tax=Pollicipes pollicipes TaxID=41117 RepID=UPI0018854BDE
MSDSEDADDLSGSEASGPTFANRGAADDEAEEARPGEEEPSGDSEPEGEDLDKSDYDSEEDEDEDEERRGSKKRKKKKDRFGGFILEEAEEDGDADEDEEWDAEADNYDIMANEEGEVGPTAQEIEQRRRRNQMMWDTQNEDEIEEYYRRKYAEEGAGARHFGDGGEEMSDEITQQTLLPGVKDPNLWMVKCRIGEERATVMKLMAKFITLSNKDEPLQIKSVVAPEGVKGYIYIEAYKQTHVKQAIEGIGNLRMGQYTQQMVPIKEMTDVMRVIKEQMVLKRGCWVRLKRGVFKDDIAQVDYVDPGQSSVHLKLIPRIDYSRMRGALRDKENEVKRKRRQRPPQKLFDMEAVRSIGGEISQDGDFIIFEGNRYSRKGFLYKNFVMSAIQAEGVKPTLSELEKFEEQPESLDMELAHSAKTEEGHSFTPGDNVEVVEGELINLQGTIVKIDGTKVTIMPKHEDLKDPLEFPAHELKKYFCMGDHVKVISGRYEGDTGLIVSVEDNKAVLFSDLTMHELKVLPQDLQLCSDMATGVDSMGQFQYGDMVQLDPQTVGVIVRLERENLHVLNMHGKIIKVKPQAVHKKKDSRYAVALDTEQNTIQRRDIVKVIDGPHSGRQGEIKHLFRSFAFLYSRMMLENGGIFVCRTRHLVLAGGSKGVGTSAGGAGFMSPRLSSPAHPTGGGAAGAGGGGGIFVCRT